MRARATAGIHLKLRRILKPPAFHRLLTLRDQRNRDTSIEVRLGGGLPLHFQVDLGVADRRTMLDLPAGVRLQPGRLTVEFTRLRAQIREIVFNY